MATSEPVQVEWRKSVRSSANGACVQVARLDAAIGLRDSKNPAGGYLSVAPEAFGALIASIKQVSESTR